jgi:caffeoyl-CoA O-methyltransferase
MISKTVSDYIEGHTTDEDPLLWQLNRETHLKTYYPNMLSGKVQGKLLEMLVHMLQPKRILEIGTFTGYSALAMAKALPEDGLLYTIDANEEIESFARSYFEKAPSGKKIRFLLGDALQVVPGLDEIFDLIFIDADKMHYPEYYEIAMDKLRKGGFMIADNVLWGGKVVAENIHPDKETRGVITFNERVKNDTRVEQVLLSVRDGLMLIRKTE